MARTVYRMLCANSLKSVVSQNSVVMVTEPASVYCLLCVVLRAHVSLHGASLYGQRQKTHVTVY